MAAKDHIRSLAHKLQKPRAKRPATCQGRQDAERKDRCSSHGIL